MAGPLTVSVIVPAHDAEPFLEATLASCVSQTLPPLEVIVVDDASRDGTARTAAAFGPPVKVMAGRGLGVSAARNDGVAAASGEVIAFCDHDDLWEPDKLRRQAEVFQADQGAAMVFTQAVVDDPGAPAGAGTRTIPFIADPEAFLRRAHEELAHWNFVPLSAAAVRASALAGLQGPFDPRYALSEDWDLWLRLARRHPAGLRYIPEPLTRYRIVPGRATARMADLRLEDLAVFEAEMEASPWLEAADPARCRATRHRLHREAGYWLLREGRGPEARSHLGAAWRLRPTSVAPLVRLAASLVPWAALGAHRRG
ncbi:MAG TPA: glycosyltransferase family 2 protein [Candidatus Polarisedimenticolia bacterium]|nr:glycosyltransferase family 2 protein [Candidatus Polarisedimenticolia bacterium]